MPRVPDILPGVGASPSRVGGFSAPEVVQGRDFTGQQLMQLGRAAEQAGQEWGRLGEQQQAEMDEAKVFEAVNATEEGDIKEESSFRNLAGKAAGDGFEPFMKSAQERRRKVLESAENERQRLMMERALTRTMTDLSRRGMAHRDAQVKEFKAAELQTGVSMSGQQFAMLAAAGDEKGAALHYNTMVGRAVQLADTRQLPADSELRKALMLGATTDAHASAVKMMLEGNRPQEAEAYLKQHGNEIVPEVRAELAATARAGSIEVMARNAFGAADTFTERKRFIDEAEDMTPKEQESATRHLVQMQDQESRENARIALDVKRQADEWNSANPFLDMRSENPALYSQVAKYGVTSERERVNVQQFIDESRTAEGMRRLRALSPEQLDETLARFTTSSTGEQIKAMVLGDQSTVTILQNTKELAGSIGVDVKDEDAFNRWRRNTIDPLVDAESTKLGRNLTPTEFQKLVVNPLMGDKVLVDGFFGYTEMPVIQAQQQGFLPIDDPATEVDESLDVKNATVAVRVDGQVVRLAQIPMDQRRKIREAYRQEWVAQRGGAATMPQMTAAEEAARWVRGGRVGDKTKRAAEDMRVPGVGWGVGDLNRADLPPLPDRSGEPDQYLIPGVQQAELPK